MCGSAQMRARPRRARLVFVATASREEPPAAPPAKQRWADRLAVPDMWAAIAIAVMWLAVLFDAIYGPNIESTTNAGQNTTSVPSAVVVALFAYLGTRVVAKHGFGHGRD